MTQGLRPLRPVQVVYLRLCGGCHGIQGVSAPELVPTLKDEVGRFLCTPESRDYVVRLPNIALAPVSDAMLAQLLNFVVFGMGRASVPAGAPQYDAVEIARLRQRPITSDLYAYRQNILAEVRGCARRRGVAGAR